MHHYFMLFVVAVTVVLAASCAVPQTGAAPAPAGAHTTYTYVIVHGAWGGAWDWKEVDHRLRADGHDVYRPTLTGQGERVHLATPDIDLNTHITDVENVIKFENLHNIILVGHSYGGMVITGVAERLADRIKAMVYIDAILPEDGESVNTAAPGQRAVPTRVVTNGFINPTWAVPADPPHDVPMPAKTLSQIITLKNPAARKIPAVYLLLVDPGKTPEQDAFYGYSQRAKSHGMTVWSFESDHNAQRSHIPQLVKALEDAPGAAKIGP
ncbi:MAG TPA: alpha/beta hydrolase [Phycisphaerae bacterium]|jgi:pimeloyl-ACP methyl ester carboxylesterase